MSFLKKISEWSVWWHLLIALIVIVLFCVSLVGGINLYTHHGSSVEVPELMGLDYNRAIELGKKNNLLVIINDSTYNKKIAAGSVVAQMPSAGARVKPGRIIYLTINSLTMPRVEIPDLIDNSSYREAQAKLAALDFNLQPPKLVDGEKDWVYGIQCDGRNLVAGDMVAKESRLTLVIGNGLVEDEMELMDENLMEEDNSDIDTFLEVNEEEDGNDL